MLDQQGGEIALVAATCRGRSRRTASSSQDGSAKAIGLSQPKSLDELVKVGNNMFRPLGKVEPVPLAERNVRQGYLEMSGANPVRQMMAMIETHARLRSQHADDSKSGQRDRHADQPRAAKLIGHNRHDRYVSR